MALRRKELGYAKGKKNYNTAKHTTYEPNLVLAFGARRALRDTE